MLESWTECVGVPILPFLNIGLDRIGSILFDVPIY